MISRIVKKAVSFLFIACMIIIPLHAVNAYDKHNLTDEELHAFMGIITNFILTSDSNIVETPTLTSNPESNTTGNNITVEVHASTGNTVYVNGIASGIVEANGTVSIALPLNIGDNEIRITVKDTSGNESEALVLNIHTSSVNHVPVGTADSISTNEDTLVIIDVLDNDSDIDGNPLNITNLSTPANGTVSIVDNKVHYTPHINWNGTDIFTYTPNDGIEDGDEATVTVTVVAVNDAPVGTADSISTNEDTLVTIDVLGNDSDLENNTLSIKHFTNPTNGTVSIVSDKIEYTPTANWSGTDTFTYSPNDGTVDGNEVTVTVTVNAVNDAPVAQKSNITVDGNSNANAITLTATDIDNETLTYTIISNPTHGSLSGTAPNITYTPTFNYDGIDSFTFKVNDGNLDSSIETFSIIVKESTEKQIVRRHNVYRNLEFTDSNLTWDTTLATHAQQWADYLAIHYTQADSDAGKNPHASVYDKDTHGLPYEGEGENIAWASPNLKYIRDEAVDISVEDSAIENNEYGAVDMWANEKVYYDYDSNSGNGNIVGHYTQIVWKKTTKVGCGKANSDTDLGGEYVVCRYSIPGNYVGEKPY